MNQIRILGVTVILVFVILCGMLLSYVNHNSSLKRELANLKEEHVLTTREIDSLTDDHSKCMIGKETQESNFKRQSESLKSCIGEKSILQREVDDMKNDKEMTSNELQRCQEQSNELSEKLRRMLGVEEKFDKLNEELENYRTEMAVTETQKQECLGNLKICQESVNAAASRINAKSEESKEEPSTNIPHDKNPLEEEQNVKTNDVQPKTNDVDDIDDIDDLANSTSVSHI